MTILHNKKSACIGTNCKLQNWSKRSIKIYKETNQSKLLIAESGDR